MRAAMEYALSPVDAYIAEHGALNAVLFLLMSLVLLTAAVGLIRGRGRASPAYAEPPVFAPVLPSQRGLQEPARNRGRSIGQ